MQEPVIRVAAEEDAPRILAVYAPYIARTAITFEYDAPTPAQFRERIAHTLRRYPYLAAEQDGEILGYAYAGTFIGRSACDWAAEASIYLRADCRRAGLGRRLYGALEAVCRAQNLVNLNASVACADEEDEYLTRDSLLFHEHMGFREIGRFRKCGYKFGRWYDLAWMEKWIGPHGDSPAPPIPFPALSADTLLACGVQPARGRESAGGRG